MKYCRRQTWSQPHTGSLDYIPTGSFYWMITEMTSHLFAITCFFKTLKRFAIQSKCLFSGIWPKTHLPRDEGTERENLGFIPAVLSSPVDVVTYAVLMFSVCQCVSSWVTSVSAGEQLSARLCWTSPIGWYSPSRRSSTVQWRRPLLICCESVALRLISETITSCCLVEVSGQTHEDTRI